MPAQTIDIPTSPLGSIRIELDHGQPPRCFVNGEIANESQVAEVQEMLNTFSTGPVTETWDVAP